MNEYRRLRDIPGQAIVEWYEAVGADDDTDLFVDFGGLCKILDDSKELPRDVAFEYVEDVNGWIALVSVTNNAGGDVYFVPAKLNDEIIMEIKKNV
jgi:hypothetical protein